MHTRFTDLVGCTVPIQQAGFDSLNIDLAAAISGAGGLGMIGAPLVSAEALSAGFDEISTRTDAPVGANFAIPFFDIARDADVLAVATARGAIVEFFYGDPDASLIERIHQGGGLAAWQVGSVAEAVSAAQLGCDMVVIQGNEAGGHVRGTTALLPLLADVLEQVEVPVVAAGGISNPRTLAAVLAAGASGARIGTAFVATPEADFHADYKRAVVEASGDDTVYTDVFAALWPDAPHRVLRSAVEAVEAVQTPTVGEMDLGGQRTQLPRAAGMAPHAATTGQIDAMALFAGEGVGSVTAIRPAAEVMRDLIEGATALLRDSAALVDRADAG